MAEDLRSTRWAFVHDGPFVAFARYSAMVGPICAALMLGFAVYAIIGHRRGEALWFWLLIALWGAAFVVLGTRQFRTLNRAVGELAGDPGGLTLTPESLAIDCPALLTSPLIVDRSDVEAIHTGRPPMGFSWNHGTRFTLSLRRPHARVQIALPVSIPQARNVPMAASPYTLPSRRRRAPALVFRFADPEGAVEALQQWLFGGDDLAGPPESSGERG